MVRRKTAASFPPLTKAKEMYEMISASEDLRDPPGRGSPVPSLHVPSIDKRMVHKHFEHNVLISHLARADEAELAPAGADAGEAREKMERFIATLHVRRDHPFFFEHPRDHVPGLYLIEAGRQMQVAVAHAFYGVPFGVEFIMTQLNVEFCSPANVFDPLTAHSATSKVVLRKGAPVSMHVAGDFRQNGLEIARMSGVLMMMDTRLLARLERRGGRS
jgi:A-factor biosynthesis hotdog protein